VTNIFLFENITKIEAPFWPTLSADYQHDTFVSTSKVNNPPLFGLLYQRTINMILLYQRQIVYKRGWQKFSYPIPCYEQLFEVGKFFATLTKDNKSFS